MYHVATIDIRPGTPEYAYLDYACLCANNMYNVANFHIRNLMTGLKKPEGSRTSNEVNVIRTVLEAIPPVNTKLKEKHDRTVQRIMADGRLTDKEKAARVKYVRYIQFEEPTSDKWFAGYNLLDAVFRHVKNPDYKAHHNHLVQNAISDCVEAWTSFFKQPTEGNGFGKKRIPGYRKSGGRSTAVFSNIACTIRHGSLMFPYADLPGRKRCRISMRISEIPRVSSGKLIEVRVVPYFGSYQVQIVTDDGLQESDILPAEDRIVGEDGRPAGVMMLDPGLNNFASIVDNKGDIPIVIKGGALKARNQWFNKRMAFLRSEQMKGHDPKEYHPPVTKRMSALSRKRSAFMRDTFYKYAHFICRLMDERDLSYLIVGHNEGQKQNAGMGHVNNQAFVSIPYSKFNHILRTVGRQYGISVILQEESYTSKACFAAKDPIPTYGEDDAAGVAFSGRRTKRGLYRQDDGRVLNADINGSANIGRKHDSRIFPEDMDTSYLYGTVAALKYNDITGPHRQCKKYSR